MLFIFVFNYDLTCTFYKRFKSYTKTMSYNNNLKIQGQTFFKNQQHFGILVKNEVRTLAQKCRHVSSVLFLKQPRICYHCSGHSSDQVFVSRIDNRLMAKSIYLNLLLIPSWSTNQEKCARSSVLKIYWTQLHVKDPETLTCAGRNSQIVFKY